MLSRRNVNLKMLYWSSKNLSVSQPEFPVKRVDRNEKSSMSQSQKTEKVHLFSRLETWKFEKQLQRCARNNC